MADVVKLIILVIAAAYVLFLLFATVVAVISDIQVARSIKKREAMASANSAKVHQTPYALELEQMSAAQRAKATGGKSNG